MRCYVRFVVYMMCTSGSLLVMINIDTTSLIRNAEGKLDRGTVLGTPLMTTLNEKKAIELRWTISSLVC